MATVCAHKNPKGIFPTWSVAMKLNSGGHECQIHEIIHFSKIKFASDQI